MNIHHFIDSATDQARKTFILHVLEVGRDHADWKNADGVLLDNLHVFLTFLRHTRKLMKMDIYRYSARTIVEHMRFNSDVSDSDVTFKINNNLIPDLARMAMLAFPVLDGFFETRNGNRDVVVQAYFQEAA
jgi:hypothetical protein